MQYLADSKGYNSELIDFFYLNSVSINDRLVISSGVTTALKTYLLREPENFDGFLRYLIRSYTQPNDGTFTFEPFTAEIFGSWEAFEHDLANFTPIDDGVKKMYPIIVKYKQYKTRGEKFFKPTEGEREEILRHLETTGQIGQRRRGTMTL